MSAALPALTKLIRKGNELISSFTNSPEKIAKLQEVIGGIADRIVNFIPTAFSYVQQFVGYLVWGFNMAGKVFGWIKDNLVWITPAILGIVSAMAAVVTAIGVLVAGIYLLWKNWEQVSTWMVGIWQDNVLPFFQRVGDFFAGIWDGMMTGFKAYVNFWIGALNALIGSLNGLSITVPDWVPGFGGKEFGFNIPLIPTFAKGGFANQPSIFGESGPEAAIPLKRTPRSLSLLNKTAQMFGAESGGGSPQFVFAPEINGADPGTVKGQIQEAGEDFFEKCDRWWESRRRLSFG